MVKVFSSYKTNDQNTHISVFQIFVRILLKNNRIPENQRLMEPLKNAVFTNCNDKYVPYAIVALDAFASKNNCDKYIIGKEFSQTSKDLCRDHGVKIRTCDLSKDFIYFDKRPYAREYPIESFYRFYGYKILNEYNFLFFVEPDVLSLKPLNLDLSNIKYVAGASIKGNRLVSIIGQKRIALIKNKFGISDINRKRILGGFRVYNVKGLLSVNFYEKIIEYYKTSISGGYHICDDDTLSSVCQLINPTYFHLISHNYDWIYEDADKLIDEIYNIHFHPTKPWKKWNLNINKSFHKIYRNFVFSNYNGNFLKNYYGELFNQHENTLVTGYFQLSDWDNRKPKKGYLKNGEKLLSIDIPMIIFTNKHLMKDIWNMRRKHNLLNKTFIYPLTIEELYYCKYRDRVITCYNNGGCPIGLNSKEKETPDYLTIVNSKLHMVKLAIEVNPFKSSLFSWIDFGIFHVPNIILGNIKNTLSRVSDILHDVPKKQITACCICETSNLETKNRKRYYSERRCKVISGFMSGGIIAWNKLLPLYEKELEVNIKTGHPSLEEIIIGAISSEHREIFNLYYGDYEDIFRSYFECLGRRVVLVENIKYMVRYKMYDKLLKLASSALRSHGYQKNKFSLDNLNFLCSEITKIPPEIIESNEEYLFPWTRSKFHLNLDLSVRDYLPTKGLGWKDYLRCLDFEKIFSLPLILGNTNSHIPKNPVKHRSTIVTLFSDVQSITNENTRERIVGGNLEHYLKCGNKLLDTDRPMIILMDPKGIDYVYNYRKKKGLLDKTVILPFSLTESPNYLFKPLISQCFEERRSSNLLDTKSFVHRILLIIFHNKFKALEYSLANNYFSSEVFIWSDFAIFKDPSRITKNTTLETITDSCPDNKIKMCLIEDSNAKEVSNKEHFYKTKRWKVVGGLISVPGKLMNTFISLWNRELKNSLEIGIPAFEEQILSCVKASRSELFDCYYGDYVNIFNSYNGYKTADYITLSNLRHCRKYKIWRTSIFIAERMFKMSNKEILRNGYSFGKLAEIYDELLIGCWYGKRKDLSKNSAQRTIELSINCKLTPHLIKHLNKNLAFHGLSIKT